MIDDHSIQLPITDVDEYQMTSEKKVILISGSYKPGGFCAFRKGLIDT